MSQIGGGVELLPADFGVPIESAEQSSIGALLEDRHETLWIGTATGLFRRWPDGSAARYGKREGLPDEYIHDQLKDRRGSRSHTQRWSSVAGCLQRLRRLSGRPFFDYQVLPC